MEWMDGWMDGWSQMDGWMEPNGWMDGWMDGFQSASELPRVQSPAFQSKLDGCKGGWLDGCKCGWMQVWMDVDWMDVSWMDAR